MEMRSSTTLSSSRGFIGGGVKEFRHGPGRTGEQDSGQTGRGTAGRPIARTGSRGKVLGLSSRMTQFTSKTERRLWVWALACLCAIYLSAFFAGALVEVLGSQLLLGVTFAAGLALSCVAVVGMALTGRIRGEVWVGLAVAVVFAMVPVRFGVPPLERTHLFEYGLFSVLVHQALVERRKNGAPVRLPGLFAILVTAAFGWLDEALQMFVPSRVYDLRDVMVNSLAGIVAVSAFGALRFGRNLARKKKGKGRSVEEPTGKVRDGP